MSALPKALERRVVEAPILGGLGHWLGRSVLPASRVAPLPFEGLPAGVGELRSGYPALMLYSDAASRERLMVAILRQLEAGASAHHATWLSGPAGSSLGLRQQVRAATRAGVLDAMAWSEDAAAQLRELGPGYLLQELATIGMHRHDLWIVDLIEPWLADAGRALSVERLVSEATHCLREWAGEHSGPILALAPASRLGMTLLPLAADSAVPALAQFDASASAARLDVVRWASRLRHGAEPYGRRWELDVTESGRWRARAASGLDLAGALQAPDARAVHALRAAVHDMSALPEGWQAHDSLESLLAAADGAVAATIVLCFQSPEDLAPLAHVVSRLRRQHPRWMRIVVRERDCCARSHGALALRRLGADALVHGDASPACLERAVRELDARSAPHDLSIEPEALLQRLTPEAVHGFMTPPAFCATVRCMLERTAGLRLTHSLVHLPLLSRVPVAAALHACALRRDGDLVTADAEGLHVFLFGCAADDVLNTLESMFAFPCSELARCVRIDPDPDSQRQSLLALQASFRAGQAWPVPPGAHTAPHAVTLALDAAPQRVEACVLPLRDASV